MKERVLKRGRDELVWASADGTRARVETSSCREEKSGSATPSLGVSRALSAAGSERARFFSRRRASQRLASHLPLLVPVVHRASREARSSSAFSPCARAPANEAQSSDRTTDPTDNNNPLPSVSKSLPARARPSLPPRVDDPLIDRAPPDPREATRLRVARVTHATAQRRKVPEKERERYRRAHHVRPALPARGGGRAWFVYSSPTTACDADHGGAIQAPPRRHQRRRRRRGAEAAAVGGALFLLAQRA